MTALPAPLPEEYQWLDGGQGYVVCAFYTPDYLPHVIELKRSLEQFQINHFLKRYPGGSSWEAGTRLKPVFIAECLSKLNTNILYVDADAIVRQPLSLLDTVATDVALWLQPVRKRGREHVRVAPGTVFVRNTNGGRRFAEAWKDGGKDCGPLSLDGEMLQMAMGRLPGLTLTLLPATYAKVPDGDASQHVIQHLHVSRGKFKWRPALRRVRRIALIVGFLGVLAVTAYSFLAG